MRRLAWAKQLGRSLLVGKPSFLHICVILLYWPQYPEINRFLKYFIGFWIPFEKAGHRDHCEGTVCPKIGKAWEIGIFNVTLQI